MKKLFYILFGLCAVIIWTSGFLLLGLLLFIENALNIHKTDFRDIVGLIIAPSYSLWNYIKNDKFLFID